MGALGDTGCSGLTVASKKRARSWFPCLGVRSSLGKGPRKMQLAEDLRNKSSGIGSKCYHRVLPRERPTDRHTR